MLYKMNFNNAIGMYRLTGRLSELPGKKDWTFKETSPGNLLLNFVV